MFCLFTLIPTRTKQINLSLFLNILVEHLESQIGSETAYPISMMMLYIHHPATTCCAVRLKQMFQGTDELRAKTAVKPEGRRLWKPLSHWSQDPPVHFWAWVCSLSPHPPSVFWSFVVVTGTIGYSLTEWKPVIQSPATGKRLNTGSSFLVWEGSRL